MAKKRMQSKTGKDEGKTQIKSSENKIPEYSDEELLYGIFNDAIKTEEARAIQVRVTNQNSYDTEYKPEETSDEEFVIDSVHKLIDWKVLRRKDSMERDFCDPSDLSLKEPLSQSEQAELKELEDVAKQSDYYFLKGGFALYEIWRKKLYREASYFFTDYLNENFEFSRVRAYQIMTAAVVHRCLSHHFSEAQLPKKVAPFLALKEIAVADYPKVYQQAIEISHSENKSIKKLPTVVNIRSAIRELGLNQKPKRSDDDDECEDSEKRSVEFRQFQRDIKRINRDVDELAIVTIKPFLSQLIMRLNTIELEDAKQMLTEVIGKLDDIITKARNTAEKHVKDPITASGMMKMREAKKWGFYENPAYECELHGVLKSEDDTEPAPLPKNPWLHVKGKCIVIETTKQPDGQLQTIHISRIKQMSKRMKS